MDKLELTDLRDQLRRSDERYLELLRVTSLSVGIYTLPAGATDQQQPHTEDEVYYVVEGRARIAVGEDDQPVAAGSIVYVAAGVEHRFHSITAELTTLVFFAPAEGTHSEDAGVDS